MNASQRTTAIIVLGLIALGCLVSGTVLSLNHIDAGPAWAVFGTAVGAIAGVVVPRTTDA